MYDTEVLNNEVSDVYEKTLLSVPSSVDDLELDDKFINDFILNFLGSTVNGVRITDDSDSRCRSAVIDLFSEIEQDLNYVRVNHVDVRNVSSDLNMLRMFVNGTKGLDPTIQKAYYKVRNAVDEGSKDYEVLKQAEDKINSIKASIKTEDDGYDYTKEGIEDYFSAKGLLKGGKLDPNEMVSNPVEVEELMNALSHIVDNVNGVAEAMDCRWAQELAKTGYLAGIPYVAEKTRKTPDEVKALFKEWYGKGTEFIGEDAHDDPMVRATEACYKVFKDCQGKIGLIRENSAEIEGMSLSVTVDPYKKFIFNMIKEGKVAKKDNEPITIVDVNKITPKDIITLFTNIKYSMFQLGPKDRFQTDVIEFDADFATKMEKLKPYIEFLNSKELNPVIASGTPEEQAQIKPKRSPLIGAYILTKAVYDTFNGCRMRYSPTDTTFEDKKVPSEGSFYAAINKYCAEFPNSEISLNYVFDYKTMFTADMAYFPIEQIVKQNQALWYWMLYYRQTRIEAYATELMDKYQAKNRPVKHISEEVSQKFNTVMNGKAQLSKYCDYLDVSPAIEPQQYVDAFNTLSNGIAYAFNGKVNDKETEYNLWSMLKKLAKKAPTSFDKEVRNEFINVAYTQEDMFFRINLAVKAGVLNERYQFTGNFGKLENGRNRQAAIIENIMTLLYKYAVGVMFRKTNLVVQKYEKAMSMRMVRPYLTKVYGIAKEYNDAFEQNHAEELGCTRKASDAIVKILTKYVGG